MQTKKIIPFAIVILSFACAAPSYGQTHTRPQRQRQTSKKKQLSIEADPRLFPPAPRCLLSLKQSPTIRGFRLGMSIDEVKRRFTTGFENARADRLGVISVQLPEAGVRWSSVAVNPTEFDGVFQLGFVFFDERLIQISYQYMPDARWRDISQFLDVLSPSLNLNQQLWDVTSTYNATLACDGFSMKAGLYLTYTPQSSPRIDMIDTAAQTLSSKRRADAIRQSEEERRRAFRP